MKSFRSIFLKYNYVLLSIFCIILCSCTRISENISEKSQENNVKDNMEAGYKMISSSEAKNIIDTHKDCIILDVREQDEYDEGHIPGAVLIPYTEIGERAEEIIKDKSQLILVYCRSGRRSKIASKELVELGYKNVYEFGGIMDWEYEIE